MINKKYFVHPLLSSEAELRTADAIVGVPFGTHGEGMPIGITNESILQEMLRLQKMYPVPLVAQWETLDSPSQPTLEFVTGTRWDWHIETHAFFTELKERRPDLKRLIIVAHQNHIRRCALVWQKMGGVALIPSLAPMPTDPLSLHQWTRNNTTNKLYEIGATTWYGLTGKI